MSRIICSLLWVVLVAGPAWARDEEEILEDEFALLEEELIVFTAAGHAQDISDSPSTITVITREEIENTHCLDVPCLLRRVPELDVRRVRPMYQAVGARALAGELSDKGLVLVDGREVNLEAFGIPLWAALPVHIQEIERIEVVRGPGSALYGANAHSLVVAIKTRRFDALGSEAALFAGENGVLSSLVRAGLKLSDWRFTLSAGHETASVNGQPAKQEKQVTRLRLLADRDGSGGRTDIQAGVVLLDGSIFTDMAPVEIRDATLAHLLISHEWEFLHARVWTSLFHTDSYFDLPLVVDLGGSMITIGKVPDNVPILSTNVDGDLHADWSFFEGNRLKGGLNYRWLTLYADSNAQKEIFQHRLGIYLQDEQRLWEQLLLTAGIRFDYNTLTPTTISPRGAANWRVAKGQMLRAAVGQAFRKPSFFNSHAHLDGIEGSGVTPQLGEFFKKNIGNEDLNNESVITYEIGYRGALLDGGLVLEADLFYNQFRHRIVFTNVIEYNSLGFPDLQQTSIQFQNDPSKLDALGGSISIRYDPLESLRLAANYTYREIFIPGSVKLKDLTTQNDNEPAHLANLMIDYRSDFGLRVGTSLYVRSGFEQNRYENGVLLAPRIIIKNPTALVLNGYLSWGFDWGGGPLTAGVRVSNITNVGYRDTAAVMRFDGVEVGGQWLGRQATLFLRGSI